MNKSSPVDLNNKFNITNTNGKVVGYIKQVDDGYKLVYGRSIDELYDSSEDAFIAAKSFRIKMKNFMHEYGVYLFYILVICVPYLVAWKFLKS